MRPRDDDPAARWTRAVRSLALILTCLASASCEHCSARSAPPVARTVALIESDPGVAEALGKPVSVSLAVTRIFRRQRLAAARGMDSVRLDTTVKGSRATAELDLSASNPENLGWTGSFELVLPGRPAVKNGAIVKEAPRTLLKGDFALDGTPRVKR